MPAKEAGGEENLSYTKQDLCNAIANEKSKNLDGVDAKQLLSLLSEMQLKEKNFYYDIEVDPDGQLKSFYYRDSIMRRDFTIFGDLIVFDTTFNTNKWGMLLAPFIRINHHERNVMFRVGFLPKENTESLEWLFETKKSMDGMTPGCMMTYQASPIASALKISFPQVKHRLCTWHIVENARNHLKPYFVMDTIAEFEHCWKGLV